MLASSLSLCFGYHLENPHNQEGVTSSTPNVTYKYKELICPVPETEGGDYFPPDLFTEEQLKKGAIVLPCIGILYMFIALALICDNYFVPSLDVLIEKVGIAPDVAGATFMAAGGSAPELFTSIIGLFLTQSDVGIGTIVGSAVFNVLFVIAACAFASATALQLTAWPLMRDTFFYCVALGLLTGFFVDSQIMWWEALILFLWYIVYVGFMKFNSAAEKKFLSWFPSLAKSEEEIDIPGGFKALRGRKLGLLVQMQKSFKVTDEEEKKGGLMGLRDILGPEEKKEVQEVVCWKDEVTEDEVTKDDVEEEEEWENPVLSGMKGGLISKVMCVISLPLTLAMFITVPDVQKPGWKSYFPLTFIMSLVWITAFSYCMVWWATMVCTVTGMSQATMGITFLAAGTSVPDLITSVIVAKAGHGDMAVSSSIGSNIFDVTVGLPLPWLLYYPIQNTLSVHVSSSGMACNMGMLFLMLVAVIASILLFKWRMTKPMGVIMMILYATFLGVALSLTQCWIICPV